MFSCLWHFITTILPLYYTYCVSQYTERSYIFAVLHPKSYEFRAASSVVLLFVQQKKGNEVDRILVVYLFEPKLLPVYYVHHKKGVFATLCKSSENFNQIEFECRMLSFSGNQEKYTESDKLRSVPSRLTYFLFPKLHCRIRFFLSCWILLYYVLHI